MLCIFSYFSNIRFILPGAEREGSPNPSLRIVEAVESAAHLRTGEEIAKSIRKAGWRIWYGTLHNDITVLVSKTEVGIGRAAEDFVGRFRIQQGGKDLYVTLLKRAEYSPPFLKNVNFGVGDSDKVLLRTFGQGLQYVRNIFQQQSLQFMRHLAMPLKRFKMLLVSFPRLDF